MWPVPAARDRLPHTARTGSDTAGTGDRPSPANCENGIPALGFHATLESRVRCGFVAIRPVAYREAMQFECGPSMG